MSAIRTAAGIVATPAFLRGRQCSDEPDHYAYQTRSTIASETDALLLLQRWAGNRFVASMLNSSLAVRPNGIGASPQPSDEPSSENHPPPFPVDHSSLIGALGPGQSFPMSTAAPLGAQLGDKTSGIVVHNNAMADHAAKCLGADAFAVGNHIGFRRNKYAPASPQGVALLHHEASHVCADAGSSGSAKNSVQLKSSHDLIDVVDVEMNGLTFVLRTDQGVGANAVAKGSKVVVIDWNHLGKTARVKPVGGGAGVATLDVPKLALEPDLPGAAGVRPYNVDVAGQEGAVERLGANADKTRSDVATWKSDESKYTRKHEYWEKSLKRVEADLAEREKRLEGAEQELSRTLVRQEMYNRFDPIIKQWVDYYDSGFKPSEKLDPNIVKSMIFQESRFGMSGEHLEVTSDWSSADKSPLRSRFNVMQTVDSYASQQLLMIEEMDSGIFAAHGLDALKKKSHHDSMTEAEIWDWNSGELGKATREFHEKRVAGKNLMGTGGKDLFEDYAFWIRTAVRWLYLKFFTLPSKGRSWDEAVRAYNGSGRKARGYARDVMSRVGTNDPFDVTKFEREKEAARKRKKR